MKRTLKFIGDTAPLEPTSTRGKLALVLLDKSQRAYAIDRTLTVGRDADADVCVDDPSVSRRHLTVEPGAPPVVVDLGSRNGTFVGGVKIAKGARVPAPAGTHVRVGNVAMLVDLDKPWARSERGSDPHLTLDRSGPMREAFDTAARLSKDDITVLLTGETGVGKEVMARWIHDHSARASHPFVPVHAAALAATLFESELFGHEKGAFTGATSERVGLFEQADGGTIFFDEIGELSIDMQPKLLRVLEDRRVVRVGGRRARVVDVRILAATNRDLTSEVNEGRFRADLYFRLSAFPLALPPLRERLGELPALAKALLAEACADRDRRTASLTDDALAALAAHDWPGNVRELKSVMARALLCAADGAAELGAREIAQAIGQRPASRAAGDDERERIVSALERNAGNQTAAAAELGIARRTLLYKLDKLGLARPRKKR